MEVSLCVLHWVNIIMYSETMSNSLLEHLVLYSCKHVPHLFDGCAVLYLNHNLANVKRLDA